MMDGARTQATKTRGSPREKNNEKPNGEWNRPGDRCKNGKCTHIMNGEVVNEGTMPVCVQDGY
jgi:hypothetical protein